MIRIIQLYCLIILFSSCEEVPSLGIDDEIETPQINSISDTISGSSVLIAWEGTETARIFDYRLEFEDEFLVQEWVEWDTTSNNSVEFFNLNEGEYTFYLKGRYNLGNVGDEYSLPFSINAIDGPRLRIYPLHQIVNAGEEFDVYLYFEEVMMENDVAGLDIEIQINSDELEFISEGYAEGELISAFSGTTIWPDPNYSEEGSILNIVGVADSEGIGLYGTGSLIKFRLRAKDQLGGFNINIIQGDNSFLKLNGQPTSFGEPIGGTVEVIE